MQFADSIKKEVGIATMAVGLITEAGQAEEIVASGKADMVALARGILYDPRWGLARRRRELGGTVDAPPQHWRSQPSTQKRAVRQDHVRGEVAARRARDTTA